MDDGIGYVDAFLRAAKRADAVPEMRVRVVSSRSPDQESPLILFFALIHNHESVVDGGVFLSGTSVWNKSRFVCCVFGVKFWNWNSPRPCWNYPDWERRISDGSVIFQSSLHLNVPFIPKQP